MPTNTRENNKFIFYKIIYNLIMPIIVLKEKFQVNDTDAFLNQVVAKRAAYLIITSIAVRLRNEKVPF